MSYTDITERHVVKIVVQYFSKKFPKFIYLQLSTVVVLKYRWNNSKQLSSLLCDRNRFFHTSACSAWRLLTGTISCLESENENLQIRSQGVVSEPDPGFSPQLDLWILDLIYIARPCFSTFLSVFLYFWTEICRQYPLCVEGFFFFLFILHLSSPLSFSPN